MNPYRRAAQSVIQLLAFGLILIALLLLGSYVFYWRTGESPQGGALAIFLKTLPALLGIGLLMKSKAIARKLTEDFDE